MIVVEHDRQLAGRARRRRGCSTARRARSNVVAAAVRQVDVDAPRAVADRGLGRVALEHDRRCRRRAARPDRRGTRRRRRWGRTWSWRRRTMVGGGGEVGVGGRRGRAGRCRAAERRQRARGGGRLGRPGSVLAGVGRRGRVVGAGACRWRRRPRPGVAGRSVRRWRRPPSRRGRRGAVGGRRRRRWRSPSPSRRGRRRGGAGVADGALVRRPSLGGTSSWCSWSAGRCTPAAPAGAYTLAGRPRRASSA